MLVLTILVVGMFFNREKTATPAGLDGFALCLKDKGAVFYGTFWCSHCQSQKKLLGESKNLPYVECSTPTGTDQTQICKDKKIEGYPTWIFADGAIQSGELSLGQLSQKTGCALPE